jgi:hypothetical protein
MLGNIVFSQVEKMLGYKLNDNDKNIWKKFHNNNANLEGMENCFHVFHIPTCIVFKGEKAKQAILEMFTDDKITNPVGKFRVYEHKA